MRCHVSTLQQGANTEIKKSLISAVLFLSAVFSASSHATSVIPTGQSCMVQLGGTYVIQADVQGACTILANAYLGTVTACNPSTGDFRAYGTIFSLSGDMRGGISCGGAPVCQTDNGYKYNPDTGMCDANTCPAHSSGTPCNCETGYKFDAAGTSCVPACIVANHIVEPLTPLDPAVQRYEDGYIDMENLTQATRDGAACIMRSPQARRIVSGYRPPTYQTHLRDVYDKWQLLKNNNDAACADTKLKVEDEYNKHGFAHQPGVTSRHSAGRAVDISLRHYRDADTLAAGCVMSRAVDGDKSHFETLR